MRTVIVFNHPYEGSYCNAILNAVTKGLQKAGHEVDLIDRVLFPGVVYDHHPRGFGLVPLLKNMRSVTIITTMNKPKIMYSLLIGNLIRKVMLRSVFKTMGYKRLKWISFTSVKSVSQEKRKNWLRIIETRFSSFN